MIPFFTLILFEEYQEHVNQVLEAFEKAGLHLKLEKCEFHHQEVKYLGLICNR
jgi:sporulation-control protein spo0M